ncbi:MAG TPA: hypothetical protein VKT52_04625 [Ktedonobacterales bacterium]|nr:hypothetical protein [Ktedonobacterales bacterium]
MTRLRISFPLLLIGALVSLLVLTGCGTHGLAAPLTKPAHASLVASGASQPSGTATLEPFTGVHIVPNYRGQVIPLTGAQHPAQLREGSCVGPFIAALSDGNVITPANNGGTTTPPAATQPDPHGGMDVDVAPSASLYVVVIDHPNDPNAAIVACGNPLSSSRQYFDLYPPAEGSNGIGRGTALMEPLDSTHVTVTLNSAATAPATWAVHTGSCDGATLVTGTIPADKSAGSGVIFQSLQAGAWWVSVASTGGPSLCGEATAS